MINVEWADSISFRRMKLGNTRQFFDVHIVKRKVIMTTDLLFVNVFCLFSFIKRGGLM
jgi:hypothetical protein